jgi:glycosyltransferase involved in cell wall biosynthesis
MHILFLNSWYPNRILKQNGDFIQRHAESVALKHKVTAIHVKTDSNLKTKIEITEKDINGVKTLIAYIKKSKNPFIKIYRFLRAYLRLIKKTEPFDIIHVNKLFPVGAIAYWVKTKKNIPYIITEHHTIYHNPYNKQINFFEKFISKIIVKNASFVLPVSDNLAKAMQDFGLKGNYLKVPNVVDTDRFIVQKKRNKTFTILHVSSMNKVKNIKGILRTIKKLESKITDFKFQLIGGNAENYIKEAQFLHINLEKLDFKNQVSHAEITTYFQQASVFVLFSDVENLPCVILEAFSCGTPVISTNVGGISEYFPLDFGVLIPPKDEDALLNAILKVYTNFKNHNSAKMHQYVIDNFSKNQICDAFTEFYQKSINKQH